ncbi:MAG TPA: discoidin domain-containing protein [Silvibacterium sp.]|nr:discoidin domain-containing protein [Silvibacterium sp.]
MAGQAVGAQIVRVDTSQTLNRFDPRTSLGSGVDRIPVEAIDHDFTPQVLKQVFPAGWQPVTYRQNTELAVEAWHWNPVGTWSGPNNTGYFVGSTDSTGDIRYSFGYALPHRGDTRNDGTGNTGYSRLTDGDESSYWKSNPYLTSRFTRESDALHPQWVVVDLANETPVDTLKIAWGAPYAKKFLVQYWNGIDPIHQQTRGVWATYPGGAVIDGAGGTATLRLTDAPVPVRFLRIWMTDSSNTCDEQGQSDPRNCVGYAIRELYLGVTSKDGVFHDDVRHTADQEQTTTYASSVDPWHTAMSVVNRKEAQVGFDLFYKSGVTQGLPAMMPIAMVYDTPNNAAAEVGYLEKRKYPISAIEMGEEVDGQYMLPEDYAALYLQYASALHKVDPGLKLGGPSFEGVNQDIEVWPDGEGRTSWLGRFLDYLRAHGRISDLGFFSFEHYPFEPCRINWASLYEEPELISHIMQVWRQDGLPQGLPIYLTESNLSSSISETAQDIWGGLWLADYIGAYLNTGGNQVYFFHYLPLKMERGCNDSAGTFGMFKVGDNYQIEQPLSQFFASQMINREWLAGSGMHTLYPAATDIEDGAGHHLVTAYAVLRPDGQWSVMLVNKDQHAGHKLKVVFQKDSGGVSFVGPVHEAIFGSGQYHWCPAHRDFDAHLPLALDNAADIYAGGNAAPDGPIVEHDITAGAETQFEVPAASIVVLRGPIAKF